MAPDEVTPEDEPAVAEVAPEMPPTDGTVGPDGIPINPVDGNPIGPGFAKEPPDEDDETKYVEKVED